MKPYGPRAIVLIEKEYLKEKGKPILNDDGTPRYEIGQSGRVLSSNLEGIKKGMKVVCDFRGGFSVRKAENKKSVTVIFEKEEINAIL
jgi:hypothetical protein